MVSTVTTLPSPPSRADPTNFATEADAWNAALAQFQTELNTAIGEINNFATGSLSATSTTSNTIAGTGTKNFTIQASKAFSPGQPIIAAQTSAPTNAMYGTVTSYNSSTGALVMAVSSNTGSGSNLTDWSISAIPSVAALSAYLALAGGTMTGLLIGTTPAAGAAGYASFRLPHGAAPTTNLANGDIWTTTAALFARINGTTRQIATLDGTETFSGKTLTNPTLTGYTETPYTITDGAAFEINPANGTIQTITLGASRTPKGTSFANGQSVLLGIDDGTAYTLTWTDTTFGASGIKWMDGTAPTLATSGLTWVTLWKVGGQVYGAVSGASA